MNLPLLEKCSFVCYIKLYLNGCWDPEPAFYTVYTTKLVFFLAYNLTGSQLSLI